MEDDGANTPTRADVVAEDDYKDWSDWSHKEEETEERGVFNNDYLMGGWYMGT